MVGMPAHHPNSLFGFVRWVLFRKRKAIYFFGKIGGLYLTMTGQQACQPEVKDTNRGGGIGEEPYNKKAAHAALWFFFPKSLNASSRPLSYTIKNKRYIIHTYKGLAISA